MPRELVVPETLGASRAGAWISAWDDASNEADLTLRLPAGAVLRPTGVVLLASGIARRRQAGYTTRLVREPGSEDAWRTLQRIDFFAALGVQTHEELERHDLGEDSVPLRPITDERVAHALAEASASALRAKFERVPSSPLRMARFVFEELGVNIVQHSGAPETGFGRMESSEDRIEIACADRGIGFLASLQKNPELEGRIDDEAEALQLAVGKGLTGTSAPRRNMGLGLALLQDFADRLGGDLWIGSGRSILRRRSVAGARTTTVHAGAAWSGSWICLEAPLAG
jgi:anti-sigma regulatory factor (Ser/Thr protein kinase)